METMKPDSSENGRVKKPPCLPHNLCPSSGSLKTEESWAAIQAPARSPDGLHVGGCTPSGLLEGPSPLEGPPLLAVNGP